jgi:cytoskeletal protein RodZ
MKKLTALVVSMAFSFGIGLAVPQAFAQTPAPKEDKKGEMTEKKPEKKSAKKKSDKKDKTEKTEKKEEKK